MKDSACIYSSANLQSAEMVKNILLLDEINSVIISKQDSSYLFGEHEVYVNRDDVVKAKYILNNNKRLNNK